jgi:hypothetical protein
MVKSEHAKSTLGYWIEAPVSADTEYLERIIAVNGEASVAILRDFPLITYLESAEALTKGAELGLERGLAPGGFRSEFNRVFREIHSNSGLLSNWLPIPRGYIPDFVADYFHTRNPPDREFVLRVLDLTVDFEADLAHSDMLRKEPGKQLIILAQLPCIYRRGSQLSESARNLLVQLPGVKLGTYQLGALALSVSISECLGETETLRVCCGCEEKVKQSMQSRTIT